MPIHIYIYTYVHIYIYIYMYIHILIHIYMHEYIYIYTWMGVFQVTCVCLNWHGECLLACCLAGYSPTPLLTVGILDYPVFEICWFVRKLGIVYQYLPFFLVWGKSVFAFTTFLGSPYSSAVCSPKNSVSASSIKMVEVSSKKGKLMIFTKEHCSSWFCKGFQLLLPKDISSCWSKHLYSFCTWHDSVRSKSRTH